MYVSHPQDKNSCLLAWIWNEAKHIGYKTELYTFDALIQTGALFQILRNIDENYFGCLDARVNDTQEAYNLIQPFLTKECGKKIKLTYKNKLLQQGSIEVLLKILLYCCLHSKQKQQYISRILKLQMKIQTVLMDAIEQINSYLFNIIDHDDIIRRVQELQIESENLRQQLSASKVKQQFSKKIIKQFEDELQKVKQQLKTYKQQKQKVIQMFDFTNFDEYLSALERLQQQNKILNRYVQQLQEANNQNFQNQKVLKRDLESQSIVIVDLNDHISFLKQKIKNLKTQNGAFLTYSLNQTLDINREFGNEIYVNDKQNNIQSKKDKRKKNNMQVWQQSEQNFNKINQKQKQQGLLCQMQQLRKYNSDLIHKIETVYKTLNTMTIETSNIKQKNEKLQKENRFYRKQIGSLKRVHQRMSNDIILGKI